MNMTILIHQFRNSRYKDKMASWLLCLHNEKSLCYETLLWCHNGCGSISNHQPYNYLLNGLLRLRSLKTSKLYVTGLCEGNSPGTDEFLTQRASNAENISIWWCHHEMVSILKGSMNTAMRITSKQSSTNLAKCGNRCMIVFRPVFLFTFFIQSRMSSKFKHPFSEKKKNLSAHFKIGLYTHYLQKASDFVLGHFKHGSENGWHQTGVKALSGPMFSKPAYIWHSAPKS